mmetsp:Transcript_1372/g.5901  ORF Transcript_1372/g.5901 Transcript_1372/m.5901 type:complete len:224 (+) Transcript_1372:1412-2083(+)
MDTGALPATPAELALVGVGPARRARATLVTMLASASAFPGSLTVAAGWWKPELATRPWVSMNPFRGARGRSELARLFCVSARLSSSAAILDAPHVTGRQRRTSSSSMRTRWSTSQVGSGGKSLRTAVSKRRDACACSGHGRARNSSHDADERRDPRSLPGETEKKGTGGAVRRPNGLALCVPKRDLKKLGSRASETPSGALQSPHHASTLGQIVRERSGGTLE